MPARLILNADDFGLTLGINRAIAELHRAGVLTSATLMANGPAFDDAVDLARALPTLGVGCHIVFTDGMPVSHPESIPSLLGADGKCFRPSLIDFIQSLVRGHIAEDDLEREALAQIQKLQRAGIDVTHVDTHKHTHIFPTVARPLLRIASRCGVRAVRYPFEPRFVTQAANSATPPLRRLALRAVRLIEPSFRKLLDLTTDEITTSGTFGISATGNLTESTLRTLLSALPNDDTTLYELCCHPGYNDADLAKASTRLLHHRDIERQALLKVVPEILARPHAPTLLHYGNLGIPGFQRATGQHVRPTGNEHVL